MKKFWNSIGQFFIKIWRWFLDTAWVQVLLIVGVIIGIVMSISPLVSWISGLVEKSKASTFYKSHAITYEQLVTEKINSDGKQFVVVFHQESCSNCKTDQPYIEAWAKEHEEFTFYTIDIGDEDIMTEDNKITLNTIYAPVYNQQKIEDQNSGFSEYPDDFQTPTLAWYKGDGTEPYKVFLGIDNGTKAEAFASLNALFEIE